MTVVLWLLLFSPED